MLKHSLQDFTVLPTENFHRYVIKISSVIYLPTSSPTEYVRRLSFPHYICRKNKKKTFADGFTDGNCEPKKSFPLEIYRRIYPVGDSVTYRWMHTVGKFVGECLEYQPKISVCKFVGHCGRYYQIPTDYVLW
jgi:hypothetical protein